MFTVVFDGGFNREGAYGSYVIFNDNKLASFCHKEKYDAETCNQAEYFALISALKSLVTLATKNDKILILGDSRLVVEQLGGNYKTRNYKLRTLRSMCLGYLFGYDWKVCWWPRDQTMQFFGH